MIRPTLLAVLLALAPAPNTLAQSVDVVLIGRVSDASGGALPGATVSAMTADTGLARSAVADHEGRYLLLNLPAGTYTVRAELDGFTPRLLRTQTLHVGTTVTLDFTLPVAGVAETVNVRGAAALLETTKSTLSRIVQSDEIDALPVVDRNFNDLAALAPGVTKTGVYGGVDIGGGRDYQNGYQLDGVSAERQHLGDQHIAFAQDWIREFQVMTAQFNAEFGQAAGGVLNAITRSGGNQIAARAYGFFRTDALDARPAFAARKPPLDERRFGATVGGPVVRDRVFYFGGVERLATTSSGVVNSTFAAANGTFPSTLGRTLALAKIELRAGEDHAVRARYNEQREHTTGSGIGGISTEEHGRFSNLRAHDVAGHWGWIVSPTMLNEARGAWSTTTPRGGCNFAARNPAGTWFERAYPGAQFGCPVNFGTIAEDHLQLVQNMLWTRGAHDVKLGIQAARTRSSGDFRNFRDGRYSFERDLPFSAADPASHPFSFVMIDGPTAWDVSGWSGGAFVQDTWRLSDDLSVNLGVRYDVDGSLTALNPLVRVDRGHRTFVTDSDNIAPRAGVAWTPFDDGKRTLVRAGAGLYYDQNHNNVAATLLLNNVLVDRILTLNANSPLFNPFWPDIGRAKALLADALAQDTIPDLSQLAGVTAATNDVDARLEIPGAVQVSAGIARALTPSINASADVVHARGFDQYVIRNTNLDPVTFQRVNPNYSSIASFGNGGETRYTALQVQANVVPTAASLLKLAYTLGTRRGNTDSTLSGGGATNPFDYSEDEGPADNDVRHTLAVNGSAALPFGAHLSGIASYRSALPYSAVTSAPRPDGKPFGWRPEPRNARRGAGALAIDLRLGRVFALGAGRSADVFVEVFNLTNHTNYAGYVGTITSSAFGRPTTAGPRRRVQLGVRVDF